MPDTDKTTLTNLAGDAGSLPGSSKFDQVVDSWFNDRINDSEISRYTVAYNALRAALPDLKARLAKEN